jgi:hypothetical protein
MYFSQVFFTGSFLHLNYFFFPFYPGRGFFTNELFYTRHALSQNLFFYKFVFLQMSFFTERTSSLVFFTGRFFLHLNFLHNIRPTSPASPGFVGYNKIVTISLSHKNEYIQNGNITLHNTMQYYSNGEWPYLKSI